MKKIYSLAILILLFLFGCAKGVPEQPPPREETTAPAAEALPDSPSHQEQQVLSFDMTGYTKNGMKKWDINGRSADIIDDIIILKEIEANTYNKDRTVNLTADDGRYNKKENSVKLENNVKVTTSDGVCLCADCFEWNSATEKVTSESFVEVEKDGLYASGRGASASTKEEEIQLIKEITVKQDDMVINCNGPLIIDYAGNKASFFDSVRVLEPRGELKADFLDVFFNPDSRDIEEIIAGGNVELKRGEDIAKGQKITYTVASGQAVLTGNPEIVIYSKKDPGNEFIGD